VLIQKSFVNVGQAKDPAIRCETHNKHLPPACAFKWKLLLQSQPFPGANAAKEAEDAMKLALQAKFESLGGEFFLINKTAIQSEFARFGPAKFVIKANSARKPE
jgi:hypothetical protein